MAGSTRAPRPARGRRPGPVPEAPGADPPGPAAGPIPVRAPDFDEAPGVDWLVPRHPDLSIAVRRRVDLPGFGPRSVKGGVPHVHPPADLPGRMLAIRLHVDAADESDGAPRVLPGTYRLGRLSADEPRAIRAIRAERTCRVDAGSALPMRPLLLHASSRSTSGRRRRVVHVEYAAIDLPGGPGWASA